MKKLDLGNGDIIGLFTYYAIPSVVSMIVLTSYIIIDGIFIGNGVGANGLAAVNIAMPFIFFINSVVGMLTIGGSVVVSVKLGEAQTKQACESFSFIMSLISGLVIIVSIVGLVFINLIVHLLGASATLAPLVKEYLVVFLSLNIFYYAAFPCDIFVKVDGWPRYSMFFTIIGAVINIILDYLFVMVYHFGLKGAALASCVGAGIAGAGMITHFFSKKAVLHFTKPKGSFKLIRKIVYNGSSEFFTQVSTSITTLLFNLVILHKVGEIGVSAMSITLYVNTLVIMVMYGLSDSMQPIVSYNLGANKPKRVFKTLKVALICAEIMGIVSFLFMMFGCKPIIQAFTKGNMALTQLAVEITRVYVIAYLLMGINMVASGYFTAIGKARESVIISLARSLIFLSIGIIGLPFLIGNTGIWLAVFFSELLTLFLSLPLLKNNLMQHSIILRLSDILKI